MRGNELAAFVRATGALPEQISVLDVLSRQITRDALAGHQVVLIGGSGNYSACDGGDWLLRTLDGLRLIYELHFPMFASCWGFQALARALGGRVQNDRSRADVGTHWLQLTDAARDDPVFGCLPDPFLAQVGHEDHVVELPPGAIRLAYSERVANQAYTFADRPLYATQFHPELRAADLSARIEQYPEYLKLITGLTMDEFRQQIQDSPDSESLIPRFLAQL